MAWLCGPPSATEAGTNGCLTARRGHLGDLAPAHVLGRGVLPVVRTRRDCRLGHRLDSGFGRADVPLPGSGNSVLLVAAWHTAFNLTSATKATSGLVAAMSSTVVMVAAVVISVVWLGRSRRGTGE